MPSISLTREQLEAFLDSRPGWMVLTTIGPRGYPHSVLIEYFHRDGVIYFGGRAGTQKTKNLERNPKLSLLLESRPSPAESVAVMLQGEAEPLTAPEDQLWLAREVARAHGTPEDQLPLDVRPGGASFRVRPGRVIAWTYGGPPRSITGGAK